LTDLDTLLRWLEELALRTGLNPIYGPVVVEFPSPDPQKSGLTGFVVIAESHIAIHTYPETRKVFIDIFSCRDFAGEELINFISTSLRLKTREITISRRGSGILS